MARIRLCFFVLLIFVFNVIIPFSIFYYFQKDNQAYWTSWWSSSWTRKWNKKSSNLKYTYKTFLPNSLFENLIMNSIQQLKPPWKLLCDETNKIKIFTKKKIEFEPLCTTKKLIREEFSRSKTEFRNLLCPKMRAKFYSRFRFLIKFFILAKFNRTWATVNKIQIWDFWAIVW